MEFEEKFKNKIREKIIKQIEENFKICWDNFDKLGEEYLKDILQDILREIRSFINFYNEKISDKSKQIHFEDDITLDSIMELKRKVTVSEEEKEYIEYENETDPYRRKYEDAIIEVLIKRILLEKTNILDLKSVEELGEEVSGNRFGERYLHIKSLISGELFEKSKDEFLKMVSDKVEENFNFSINCGGYALEVDTCIFPLENDGNNFERSVSSILELFPFVRLVEDREVGEDEYLVLFRASKNGHHFIKQVDDGTFVEKEGGNPPKKFEGWSETFEDSPVAVFAVKKEHDMEYFDKYKSVIIPIKSSKDFEQTVIQALQDKQNTFEYHNHKYQFKKSNEGIIYICSGEKIVAQVLIDEKDYDIEIEEEYRGYISNTKPAEISIGTNDNTQRIEENNIEGELDDR